MPDDRPTCSAGEQLKRWLCVVRQRRRDMSERQDWAIIAALVLSGVDTRVSVFPTAAASAFAGVE